MQFKDKGISTLQLIATVGAAMLALVIALVFLWHSRASTVLPAGNITPPEEQKAYFPQLELAEAHMSAAENFLGNSVTYLDAQVTNKGTKAVRRLDVDLTFVDMLNQVVLRERVHPVTERTPPLKPGESRTFRVTFEHLPVDWNQAVPTMTPVYVQFE